MSTGNTDWRDEIAELETVLREESIVNIMMRMGLVPTGAQARRLLRQGAVKISVGKSIPIPIPFD